jgi:enoyl-CoA hydratase/carnithine racemase
MDSWLRIAQARHIVKHCGARATPELAECRLDGGAVHDTIKVTRSEGVLVLQLARPEKRNAMNQRMATEVHEELVRSSGVRAVLITGDAIAFSAGADLSEMHGADRSPITWYAVLPLLARLPLPTVAAIEGWCLGGGLELALACDLRIAGQDARLGLPEVERGLFPGGGGTQRLPRLVGPARAKELMLLGEPISGTTAGVRGLVNHVVPLGSAYEFGLALARKLAAGPPIAMAVMKSLVNDAFDLDISAGLAQELVRGSAVFASADAREGVRAFFEQRQPLFEGR